MLTVTYDNQQFVNFDKDELLKKGVPAAVILAVENKDVLEQRKSAYKVESDPLYMEWQFEQTAESEQLWREKVANIKARYPLVS